MVIHIKFAVLKKVLVFIFNMKKNVKTNLTGKCIDCGRKATHKLQAKDGTIIHACDEHLKGWFGCTEIPSLKTRIIKNKSKLALVALLLITNLVWAILYYTLWKRLPEEIVTL